MHLEELRTIELSDLLISYNGILNYSVSGHHMGVLVGKDRQIDLPHPRINLETGHAICFRRASTAAEAGSIVTREKASRCGGFASHLIHHVGSNTEIILLMYVCVGLYIEHASNNCCAACLQSAVMNIDRAPPA